MQNYSMTAFLFVLFLSISSSLLQRSGCFHSAEAGLQAEDANYTEECRLKARECGNPYYGYNSETEASKIPETACICGESTIKWYSDYQPHLSADFKCIGIRYRCLKKPARKVDPEKIFERRID